MKINIPLANDRGRRLHEAKRIVTTYGLSVEGEGVFADELEVCTPETCFCIDDDGATHVIMWTGSYPFAQDHPMGAMPSVEEAARYAVWLLKREAWWSEREENQRLAWEAEPCGCEEIYRQHTKGDH